MVTASLLGLLLLHGFVENIPTIKLVDAAEDEAGVLDEEEAGNRDGPLEGGSIGGVLAEAVPKIVSDCSKATPAEAEEYMKKNHDREDFMHDPQKYMLFDRLLRYLNEDTVRAGIYRDAPRCKIDTVSAPNLSADAFKRRFLIPRIPVVITGATEPRNLEFFENLPCLGSFAYVFGDEDAAQLYKERIDRCVI